MLRRLPRAGVAVEQVAQAVGQPPPPAAIDQRFERVAVCHQQAQQVGQVGVLQSWAI